MQLQNDLLTLARTYGYWIQICRALDEILEQHDITLVELEDNVGNPVFRIINRRDDNYNESDHTIYIDAFRDAMRELKRNIKAEKAK